MTALLQGLTLEYVATGFVGFIMLGVLVRNIILGWHEARTKMKEKEAKNPYTTAMSISWDRDQIERFLQGMETIAEALQIQCVHMEAIAEAQGVITDDFQRTTQQKLDTMLRRLDVAEQDQVPPTSRRKKPLNPRAQRRT